MTNKEMVLKAINNSPEAAQSALETIYNGKTYIVYTAYSSDVGIERYVKTKRGAEGYIKRQQQVSWYDDYTHEMVTAGSGLQIQEIKDSEIVDPSTNKKVWYLYIKKTFSKNWMLDNVICAAKRIVKDLELLEWIKVQIEEIKETGSFIWIEEFETIEEIERVTAPKAAEEIQETPEAAEETERVNTNTDIEISYNEKKSGIEIKFDGKPSEEIRANLKANGFRWSKYQKMWYAKDTPERREFIEALEGTETESDPKIYEYPEIDINDLEEYGIDPRLSKRENEGNWIFRTKERNHNKELQETLEYYQAQAVELLDQTENKEIIYHTKRDLQRFKKAYYANYTAILSNKANNPSWAVTGRAGRNANRDQKANDRYNKLIAESAELREQFENSLGRYINKIYVNKRKENYINIDNTDIELDFKVETKEITYLKVTQNLRTYNYKNYMIVKLWGAYKIFKDGEEIKNMRTTDTLNTTKKALQLIINTKNQEKQAI